MHQLEIKFFYEKTRKQISFMFLLFLQKYQRLKCVYIDFFSKFQSNKSERNMPIPELTMND